MLRKRCITKRKGLVGIILSLVVVISLIAQPMVTFAEGLTPTVDNSVDKSTTRVVGVLKLTGCTGSTDSFESGLTVYDSEKVKVDYSNPTNDYIQSLIDAAKEKTERLGQVAVDGHSGSCTLKPTETEKSESSYDNRVYTWVKDDESDDGILIGGPDSGAVGNQNRHMVITGDYARTTIYTVTVEVVFPDHVWGEGVVTTKPTETTEGVKTFICSRCGTTKTESVPALDHTHSYTATVTPPTCTEKGYTTYTCACGDSYKDTYVNALGHSYTYKVTTTPTTSASGILTGTCSRCSATTTVTLPKLNTTDYTYAVTKAATCTATGTGRYTWKTTTYGSFYFDVTIAKAAHTYKDTVTAPNCTEQGYTTHTCSVCGDSYKDTYTDALGHNWDNGVITTQPTEAKEGVKTFTCTRCGETRTESVPVLAHTHSYTAVVTKPTCTEKGYTTYTCSCGDSYVADYVAALGHNWDDGVITTKPTETTEGIKTFTCSRCGETRTESVPVLAHTHSYTAVVTKPTCTEKGYTTYTCACGDSYVADYVGALGHDFVDGTCSRCGAKDPNYKPIEPDKPCDGGASCPGKSFTDMPKVSNWAHAGIDFCVENGLFAGTSATTFSPDGNMTRAMLVTVLYRLEGQPAVTASNPFSDVANGQWFTNAIIWAADKGVVSGVGGGKFNPNGNITREQIATIMYRYAEYKSYDVSATADLKPFPDETDVSAWAYKALAWANAEGLVSGVGANGTSYLQPLGNATRAQVAAILMRYVKNISKT